MLDRPIVASYKTLLVVVILMLGLTSATFAQDDRPFEGYQMSIMMETVPETDYILSLLPEFEEQTGMTVNVEVVNFNVMYDRLITQLIGPEGSGTDDVIQATNSWSDEFARANFMVPLDDFLASSELVSRDPYVPAIWEGLNTVGDETYFIPFYHWSMGWIYRADLMADETLAAEYESAYGRELAVPSSIPELIEWQQFMTRDYDGDGETEYGTVLQGSSPQNIPEFLPYFWSYGCDFYDETGAVIFDNECGIDAINLYIEAFKNAPPGSEGMQFDQTSAVMIQGNAASTVGYLWMRGVFEGSEGSAVAGKTAIANMPGGVGFLGAWGWGIPKSAPNPEAGWAFIEWVESLPIASARAEMGGEPTRYDIYNDEALAAKFPNWPLHLEILENARTWPEGLRTEAGQDVMGRALARAVSGEITAEEAAHIIADDQRERMGAS